MLNPQQFTQLPMFMETDEVVDDLHKPESPHSPDWTDERGRHLDKWSPRDQWERRNGNYPLQEEAYDVRGRSLRQYMDEDSPQAYDAMVDRDLAPPLAVVNYGRWDALLEDGHHRLAAAQRTGKSWVPVEHREDVMEKFR